MTNDAKVLCTNTPNARCVYVTILVWITGFLSGFFFAYYFRDSFSPLMRMAASQPVSIVTLTVCCYLPLILSVFVASVHKPFLILWICLIKAISYGFAVMLILSAFTSAAWLVHFLFLFSDTCCCLLLLWFSFGCFCKDNERIRNCVRACIYLGFLAIVIDSFFIAPFFRSLFIV